MTELTLPEISVVHAIRRDSQLYYNQRYATAMTAGALIDLFLRNRVAIDATKRADVTVIDNLPTGNELLDTALADIASVKDPEPLKAVLKRLMANTYYQRAAIDRLLASGQLTPKPRKVLGFIKVTEYQEAESATAEAVRERLSRIMFGGDEAVPARDYATIMLLGEHDLMRNNYPAEKLEAHRSAIADIRYGKRSEPGPINQGLQAIRKVIDSARRSGGNAGGSAG